jgi:HSP20 family protein
MALVHRHVGGWPAFGWPKNRQQLFELADGQEWLRVEEFHDGDTLVVRAELPDIDPDKDVEITSDDGVVRIHARREQKSERKQKRGYHSEFRFGDFEREIVLPKGASAKDVKATYKDGILEVQIPCPERVEPVPTKIPISQG